MGEAAFRICYTGPRRDCAWSPSVGRVWMILMIILIFAEKPCE